MKKKKVIEVIVTVNIVSEPPEYFDEWRRSFLMLLKLQERYEKANPPKPEQEAKDE